MSDKLTICEQCEQRRTCNRLCKAAEKLINQGFRRQREVTNREDYINDMSDIDGVEAFDYVEIKSKEALLSLIIILHREGKTLSDILYHVGGNDFLKLDRSRISKIIKKWYAAGRPSDLTKYWGKLRN